MSEIATAPPHGIAPDPVERKDVRGWPATLTGLGLGLAVLVIAVGIWWIFSSSIRREMGAYGSYSLREFPQPRLERAPDRELLELRQREDAVLNAYAWGDSKHSFAEVPVDRAMRIAADKKLISLKFSSQFPKRTDHYVQ